MKSEKPSHIPLFVDSYLADTTHLTTEQHGAYLLLLMAAWRTGDCTLPHDEKRLASIAGVTPARWRSIAPAIMEMWTCEKGRCWQKRLVHEWDYVQSKRVKRKAAADARWSSKSDANALQVECTKGGGGGGGVSSQVPYQSEELVSETRARDAWRVMDGGRS